MASSFSGQTNLSNADSKLQIDNYNYLQLVTLTCLTYDYLLTLDAEIKYFWKRPNSIGHLLFFFNRYYMVIGVLVTAPITISFSESDQPHFRELVFERIYRFKVAVAALLALRVYALYIGNRLITSIMAISVIAVILLSFLSVIYHSNTPIIDPHQCPLSRTLKIFPAYAATYAVPFVYDVLVFALTASRAWRARAAIGVTWSPGSLFSILIRDSSFYFLIMVFVRLAHVITMVLGVFGPSLDGLAGLMTSVSVILTSRFMINLRGKMAEGYEITAEPRRIPFVIDIAPADTT